MIPQNMSEPCIFLLQTFLTQRRKTKPGNHSSKNSKTRRNITGSSFPLNRIFPTERLDNLILALLFKNQGGDTIGKI